MVIFTVFFIASFCEGEGDPGEGGGGVGEAYMTRSDKRVTKSLGRSRDDWRKTSPRGHSAWRKTSPRGHSASERGSFGQLIVFDFFFVTL